MRNFIQQQKFILIAILLIALAIRLIGVASRPIWYDEAFTILFAENGPSAMIYGTLDSHAPGPAEPHPLGYYILMWIWMRVFGQSLVVVRLLSILAGVVTVFFVHQLSLKLFNKRTASIAALFAALAPFQVHYSQEIRMYSFLTLWLIIATYAFVRGSKQKSWKWWAVFSIAAALAQYTHSLAVFYLIPLAITPLFYRDRKDIVAVFLSGCGALILYLPWLLQLLSQFNKIASSYWVEKPGMEKIFTLLLTYITHLPLPVIWLYAVLFIALSVFAVGLFQTFRAPGQNSSGAWLLYLSFAPAMLVFLVSQWVPVYIERAFLPSGVIFCMWLAWAIFDTGLPNLLRYVLVGGLFISFSIGIFQHVTYRGFPYAPYQDIDRYLQSQVEQNDVIVHSNKLTLLPALYFDRTLPQIFIADPPGSSTDTLAKATQEVLEVNSVRNIELATNQVKDVWFVIFERSIQESRSLGLNTHPHLQYLDQNFDRVNVKTWDGLQVFHYRR